MKETRLYILYIYIIYITGKISKCLQIFMKKDFLNFFLSTASEHNVHIW